MNELVKLWSPKSTPRCKENKFELQRKQEGRKDGVSGDAVCRQCQNSGFSGEKVYLDRAGRALGGGLCDFFFPFSKIENFSLTDECLLPQLAWGNDVSPHVGRSWGSGDPWCTLKADQHLPPGTLGYSLAPLYPAKVQVGGFGR